MLNLFNAHIESMSIHRVGNKSRNEPFFLSESIYRPTDEIIPLLKDFMLKPFRDKEELYFQFAHDVDLEYNEMYGHATAIFENPEKVHEVSKLITKHLYDNSNHPHIKSGDVFVVHFTGLQINNENVDGIGIFKSELLSDFIKVREKNTGDHNLIIELQQGISLEKHDKGCLIFNSKKEEGYKILCTDQNRYDARYWLEHFLGLDEFVDENYLTKKYLRFFQDFAKDIILPAEDKKAEVLALNRGINYFGKNDTFNEDDFLNEVIDNPDLIAEYKSYRVDKEGKYSLEDIGDFEISNSAVTEAKKKYKSIIKLDTNIEIKMDFINPESADKFVEKGWDEERQMYYYLVYFNSELK